MKQSRILVVEDDEAIKHAIENQLVLMGYTIAGDASSGKEAIGKIEETNPELIIMDIKLEGSIDGIEASKIIKEKFDIPIIFLTANTDEDIINKAKQVNPYGYLVKPIAKHDLSIAIEMALYKHKIDKELKNSEERYRLIVEDQTELICRFDKDGNITFANKAYCNYFKKDINDIIGLKYYHFLDNSDRQKFINEISNLNITTQVKTIEFNYHSNEDEVRWLRWTNRALFNEKKEINEYQSVGFDITDRKRAEEDLQRTNKLESLGTLAGGIAHDFNNIIMCILGNISLTMIKLEPDDERYKTLKEAEKAVKHARDLAHQLLTFAKGGTPVKKAMSIQDLIKESASFVLRGSKVKCEFFFEKDLPSVEVDESQISQVINNMIINADEAMPEGGKVFIRVEKEEIKEDSPSLKKGLYIKITITDQGIGIQEKHLQKIFDPYFTTKQKGNGLGLAICYSIIKKHDGNITVESKIGVGTSFYIFLPASENIMYEEEKNEMKILKGSERILVMDDELIIRDVLKKMLSHLGYNWELASNGEEAIILYKESIDLNKKFDAVIMDLTVPGKMGGEKAVKELLKIDPYAKVIVSSGYSNDPIMANYKNYGFIDCIAKPYKIEDLSVILRRVIDKK
jgi:PAS domain S-box-containing protein